MKNEFISMKNEFRSMKYEFRSMKYEFRSKLYESSRKLSRKLYGGMKSFIFYPFTSLRGALSFLE